MVFISWVYIGEIILGDGVSGFGYTWYLIRIHPSLS